MLTDSLINREPQEAKFVGGGVGGEGGSGGFVERKTRDVENSGGCVRGSSNGDG